MYVVFLCVSTLSNSRVIIDQLMPSSGDWCSVRIEARGHDGAPLPDIAGRFKVLLDEKNGSDVQTLRVSPRGEVSCLSFFFLILFFFFLFLSSSSSILDVRGFSYFMFSCRVVVDIHLWFFAFFRFLSILHAFLRHFLSILHAFLRRFLSILHVSCVFFVQHAIYH